MKIQEFRKLVEEVNINKSRRPQSINNYPNNFLVAKCNLSSMIIDYLYYNTSVDEVEDLCHLKNCLVENFGLKGNGTLNDPYTIQTWLGTCSFCDAHYFFKNLKYPEYIEKQCCHSNCYETVKKQKIKCEILSGICYRRDPFLHTVLLVDDFIVDFNYDLILSRDLYEELFNFEILNTINSDDVLANLNLFSGQTKFMKENNITYGDVCFCYYEILEILKNKQIENKSNV